MAFILTELVIESVLREGFENIRQDSSIVDDLFDNLVSLPIYKKYGQKELNKIKNILENKEISIVHGFPTTESKMPSISIQLMSAKENERRAVMDDFAEMGERAYTEDELAEQVIVSSIVINSYDPDSGVVTLDNSTNLSEVHANQILQDSAGAEFDILSGVVDTDSLKQVIIQKGADLETTGPALIKTRFTSESYEVRANTEQEVILLGIHTKEALQTKYIYTLVKYIVESRKPDLIRRGFQLATYEGSDFQPNQEYSSDFIYSRYLTVSGLIENTWNSDKVIPIDLIQVEARVPKDRAGNEDLGITDQTVQVYEEDE